MEIIDACVQYIETLQNQLEDHLIQNPQLYVESRDSGNNSSTDLHNLMHRQQDSQNNTTLDKSTYSAADANKLPSSISSYNSPLPRQKTVQYQTNLRTLVNKHNKVDKSRENYLNCKKFRLRC